MLSRDKQTGELKVNKKLCIHPLSRDRPVDPGLVNYVGENLHRIFKEVVTLESEEIPQSAFNRSRGQLNSKSVLKTVGLAGDVNLGILEEDIYSYGFNFIFGEAELGGTKAVISIFRLKPEFYGYRKDEELLKLRVLKEAVHEAGHVLGLKHCPDKHCVMHFSNTIKDTDVKDWRYCSKCLVPALNTF